jgi:copper chaperone CopZ
MKFSSVFALAAVLCFGLAARAETKVQLKGTHLCCGQCVAAVGTILKGIDGVTGKCDQKGGTVTITAKDDATAQKAIDALAAGGFHGTTDNDKIKVKDDSGVKKGKVKELTVTGVHDCCGQCNNAIKKALKTVDGVKGDNAKAKSDSIEITGDFEAEDVIKALNAAGFHVKVK